jgi:hypothetical protein
MCRKELITHQVSHPDLYRSIDVYTGHSIFSHPLTDTEPGDKARLWVAEEAIPVGTHVIIELRMPAAYI